MEHDTASKQHHVNMVITRLLWVANAAFEYDWLQ